MTSALDYLAIARDGLRPKATRPTRVVIVGAGMAQGALESGLRSAHEVHQRALGRVP